MSERPLSPHLTIYRFKHTLLTSILNRFTGVVLSLGLLPLVYWLGALASGPAAYARARTVLSLGIFKPVYAALLLAFAYHLCAGLRHLIWDTGKGMERRQACVSAWVVAGATVAVALALGYFLFCPATGLRKP